MAKHTPGPWKTEKLESHRHGYTGWDTFTVRQEQTNICVSVVGEIDRAIAPENEANARLIAAAPELLDALRDLLFFCRNYDPKEGDVTPWEKAESAVRKATEE